LTAAARPIAKPLALALSPQAGRGGMLVEANAERWAAE
jgi:hypothetical protein